jgi:DNA repair exonuclease SbcCD nuclease subunit
VEELLNPGGDMSEPIAVLISDVHFNVHTIELASLALRKAQFKAVMLKVPLVIAGDLLDTKAIIRAEVANRLIELLSVKDAPETIILVGNHDLINEKGKEHALNFLKPYATIIETIQTGHLCGVAVDLIPYQADPTVILKYLQDIEGEAQEVLLEYEHVLTKPMIIMHQGVQGSAMGDYIIDKSAVPKETFAGYRVISGHYHPRQDIVCPDGGLVSYIGNPYTLGFGEANDPEKGFQVLKNDGSLEFIPTSMRKHIIYDIAFGEPKTGSKHNPEDLVWIKFRGTKEQLSSFPKEKLIEGLEAASVKVDYIPLDQETQVPSKADTMSQSALLDNMIDSMTNTGDATKERLKALWRACASN